MKIYTSQSSYLPSPLNGYEKLYVCTIENQSCTVEIDASQIDSTKPVYISFMTDSGFQVIAGPRGEILEELAEFE